jgi:hypothetical protein
LNKLVNVYVFDSQTALYAANNQENKNQIFFYDGQKLIDAPKNCIHVPIDNFIEYFRSSSHPYPEELNFDNMNFSEATISQIIESLTNALEIVKEARLKEINTIILKELNDKNAQEIVHTLLEYVDVNNFIYAEAPFELVYKLLEATRYLQTKEIKTPQKSLKITEKLYERIPKTQSSFCMIHLKYALSLLNGLNTSQEYFASLATFKDIEQLDKDFILIKTLYKDEKLREYLIGFGEALFREEFWNKDILSQKHAVYKLYYLTSIHYGRGSAYKEIFHILYKVFISALEKELDELIFYLYTPLMMSYNGVAQTQEELKYFNEVIEKPLETFIQNTLMPKYNIKKNTKSINTNKKIKVGFVQERFINYSIYNAFKRLIKSLKEYNSNQFEFIIYNLNFKEFGGSNPQTVKDLKKLGIAYVDLHKECVDSNDEFYSIVQKSLKVRRKIIKDKVDILIGMHSRPEYNFLFTSRTCAKQIYWSHGNFEYDIPGIDLKIAHSGALSHSDAYKIFHLPIELDEYNPPIDQTLLEKTRALYPTNSFVLGSIGRLIKLDNEEYIKTVATIMKRHPETIYLACGDGDSSNIKLLLKKFGIEDRFYFTGRIDANLYGNIIDLWLTPFPYGGGSALQEYMYKAKPYVIQSKLFQKNVDIYNSYNIVEALKEQNHPFVLRELYTQEDIENLKTKAYLFEENRFFQTYSGLPFVKDTHDYIGMASLLITNPQIAAKIGKETVYKAKANENKRGAHTFLELLT